MALMWLLSTAILLLLSLLLKKKINSKLYQNKLLPPSPPKLPIIGNLHQLGELPHQSLCQLSKKYGPVMLLQFGGLQTVVISSAEAAREVLRVHDLDCCTRPPMVGPRKLSYNNRDISFAPYGDYWREMRKTCILEVFSLKRVQSYQFIREEEIGALIDSISHRASSASPVNLSDDLYSLTGNIACRITFGKGLQGSHLEDQERFKGMVLEAMFVLGTFCASEYFPWMGWIMDRLTGLHQRLDKIFKEMDNFYEKVINDHLNPSREKQEKEDIIDVLLRITKDQTQFGPVKLNKENIKAVLMNLFLAGVDTSAITLVWAMAELARKPRLMKKAQDELRNLIGEKGKISEADVDKLAYLKMIVKETLRLHPPAPLLLPRIAMSPFKVNGYSIHPKMLLQVNAWAIGRDPNSWENPEEFVPERFSESSIDYRGQSFELLPFGGGRRGCPGISMGIATVELALANLLYHFNWELPDGMKVEDINMEEAAGLTTYKKLPLKLVPVNPFRQEMLSSA